MPDKVATLCGFHAVGAALMGNGVKELYFDARRLDRRMRDLLTEAKRVGLVPQALSKSDLDQLASGTRHQGVVAIGEIHNPRTGLVHYLNSLRETPLVLVLDGLQDPGNLGGCLRNAAAADVDAVLIPRNQGCGLTPAVVRVAAGGATFVPVFEEGNWGPLLEAMKARGLWLIGSDENASDDLYHIDLTGPLALVVGSEDRGLRQLTRRRCDQLARIPTASTVRSLNVATAAGIALFEALRQRHHNLPSGHCI